MGVAAPRQIVIIGAGGVGREVLDIIEAINRDECNLDFLGFLDDGPVNQELLARRRARLLGPVSMMPGLDAGYVIGIGDGAARGRIDAELAGTDCHGETLIHPSATFGSEIVMGTGCILAAGSRITTNVTLGRHVQIHVNSTVGHDTVLGDFASVFPGATVSGNVRIGPSATVGTGASVLPGITIGEGAYIGAGAVVNRAVQPGTTVAGVPARPIERVRR